MGRADEQGSRKELARINRTRGRDGQPIAAFPLSRLATANRLCGFFARSLLPYPYAVQLAGQGQEFSGEPTESPAVQTLGHSLCPRAHAEGVLEVSYTVRICSAYFEGGM